MKITNISNAFYKEELYRKIQTYENFKYIVNAIIYNHETPTHHVEINPNMLEIYSCYIDTQKIFMLTIVNKDTKTQLYALPIFNNELHSYFYFSFNKRTPTAFKKYNIDFKSSWFFDFYRCIPSWLHVKRPYYSIIKKFLGQPITLKKEPNYKISKLLITNEVMNENCK